MCKQNTGMVQSAQSWLTARFHIYLPMSSIIVWTIEVEGIHSSTDCTACVRVAIKLINMSLALWQVIQPHLFALC
jgi:hypothetical protein